MSKNSYVNKSAYYPFFKKLANPLRIRIITSLAASRNSGKTVNELASDLNVEQSKLSHALKELSGCSIVKAERRGKNMIYSVNKSVMDVLKLIDKHSQTCCKCCTYAKK
jgi:ArsR family transcriptional regulator